jgi:hypothetical protein
VREMCSCVRNDRLSCPKQCGCFDARNVAPQNLEAFAVPLDPNRVLEASRRLLKGHAKLTVGDLSVVSAEKRKQQAAWGAKRVNRSDAVTVGDLTPGMDEQRGLQELYVGITPRPNMCQSR